MQLELKRVGSARDSQHIWNLDLGRDVVVLSDAEGVAATQLPASLAPAYLQFRRAQRLRILDVRSGEQVWSFEISKVDSQLVQSYIDRKVVDAGPQLVEQVGKFGRRLFLAGVGCLIAFALLTVGVLMSKPSVGKGLMFCLLPPFGFAALFCCWRGLFYSRYYRRLQELARRPSGE